MSLKRKKEETQLGRRGEYRSGRGWGRSGSKSDENTLFNILNKLMKIFKNNFSWKKISNNLRKRNI